MIIKQIDGQLNAAERRILMEAIMQPGEKPKNVIEVGTWLGGGSTLHILRALEQNGDGHLWGIEADHSIYEMMITNIRAAAPTAAGRFTPIFGYSQKVLRQWFLQRKENPKVDFAFLDGGNNPGEQIDEFHLLDAFIPVGGQIMAHDAKLRKGRWLAPYLFRLDNWKTCLHDVSDEGLLHAIKIAPNPSVASLRSARMRLIFQKLNPVEIAAAVIPSSVCRVVLDRLPRRFARRLTDGRP